MGTINEDLSREPYDFNLDRSLAPLRLYNNKYFNATDNAIFMKFSADAEKCNYKWGHREYCYEMEWGKQAEQIRCRLCSACRKGYKRQGHSRCRICPEETQNRLFLIIGALVFVVGAVALIMQMISAAGSDVEMSQALQKIAINFMQVASLAALFPLKWPEEIEAIFAIQSAISSPAQHLLSPDCELSWMSAADAFYNKQIGFAVLPIILVLVSVTFWSICYCCFSHHYQRSPAYYVDRAVLTVVSVLFLLYPTMVRQSLGGLACERIGVRDFLAVDLHEPCYVGRHLTYVMLLTIPQIGCYLLGLPMAATTVLFYNRRRLHNNRVTLEIQDSSL